MAVWPASIFPDEGCSESRDPQQTVNRGPLGVRQVKTPLSASGALFHGKYTFTLGRADTATIEAFVDSVNFAATSFDFFAYETHWRANLACGIGDGVVNTFSVPALDPIDESYNAAVVKVAGATKTKGVDWQWTTAGTKGEARILFLPGHLPGVGAAVTCSADVRQLFTCGLVEEPLVMRHQDVDQYVIEIEIEEWRP